MNHHHPKHKTKLLTRLFLPLLGFASLVWMLIRIIPKPSRAEYPCMKVAAPIASGFVAYIASALIAVFSFKRARRYFRNSRYVLASVLAFAALAAGLFTILRTDTETSARTMGDSLFVPTDPPNTPMGTARGIFPGRVVWVRDSTAAHWNGITGNWWSDANTNQTAVDSMFSKSLRALTEEPTDSTAWIALFKYFNSNHGKGSVGYTPGEKIAVKIDLNNVSEHVPTPAIIHLHPRNPCLVSSGSWFTKLELQTAISRSMISSGMSLIQSIPNAKPNFRTCISWDGFRRAEENNMFATRTIVHWSEKLTLEINGGNPAHLPTAVTHASYLINLRKLQRPSVRRE